MSKNYGEVDFYRSLARDIAQEQATDLESNVLSAIKAEMQRCPAMLDSDGEHANHWQEAVRIVQAVDHHLREMLVSEIEGQALAALNKLSLLERQIIWLVHMDDGDYFPDSPPATSDAFDPATYYAEGMDEIVQKLTRKTLRNLDSQQL
jgi:hypothetical protein